MLQKMEVSGVSPAAGLKSGQFIRERNSKKENIEFRIMNIECRNSAVRYSLFCGSLFRPREVSYEGLRVEGSKLRVIFIVDQDF